MRTLITTLVLLTAPASVLAESPTVCCGDGKVSGKPTSEGPSLPHPTSNQGAQGVERGMSAEEHAAIFKLLSEHEALSRKVSEIPGGVLTRTTTKDPKLVAALRTHVRQMVQHLEQGRPVRSWDPLFWNLFAHANEIKMAIKDIDGGIEVTETSENPIVVSMIRAHAAKVSDFAARGHAAARPPWAGGGRGRGRMGPGR